MIQICEISLALFYLILYFKISKIYLNFGAC
jgi:hypothetical protein